MWALTVPPPDVFNRYYASLKEGLSDLSVPRQDSVTRLQTRQCDFEMGRLSVHREALECPVYILLRIENRSDSMVCKIIEK